MASFSSSVSSSNHLIPSILATVIATLVACGIGCSSSSGVEPPDAEAGDATADSGMPDSGNNDSGQQDSAPPDAPTDAPADAPTDASPDAPADAGDGGTEAGAPDASDAGPPPDAGTFTAGELSCAACPSGTKLLGGVCVDDTKVVNGCADPAASTACSLANAVPTCAAGKCAILRCDDGWADCDGLASTGCEANLRKPTSCGACGVTCGTGQDCSAAGCVSTCSPPLTLEASSCVDLTSDPLFCGGPGACFNGGGLLAACVQGTCTYSCAVGYSACGTLPDGPGQHGGCIDLANDPANCGTCGNACPAPAGGSVACVAGHCEPLCPPGVQQCSGACVVETLDKANCGACGRACTGTDVCSLGACVSLASTVITAGLSLPSPIAEIGVAGAVDLAVDAMNVYFVDTAGLHFVPKTGGVVKDIAPATGKPLRVAVDDTYVYWSVNLAASIMRAPKDGSGTPSLVATATQPQGLVVTGGTVYWVSSSVNDFNIYAAPASGGGPTSTVTTIMHNGSVVPYIANGLQEIATDGTNLYVGASDGPYAVAIANGATSSIFNGTMFQVGAIAARPGQYCGFWTGLGGVEGFQCEAGGFGWYNNALTLPTDLALSMPRCGMAYGLTSYTQPNLGTYFVTNAGMNGGGQGFQLLPETPVSMANDGTTIYFIDTSGSVRSLPIP